MAYVAELWSVYDGLMLALENGFNRVELQVDSEAAAQCIMGSSVGCSRGRCLVQRIRHLLGLEWTVTIHHVYGEANKVALGCELDDDNVFMTFDNPPYSIRHLVSVDVLGVSTPSLICVIISLSFNSKKVYSKKRHNSTLRAP